VNLAVNCRLGGSEGGRHWVSLNLHPRFAGIHLYYPFAATFITPYAHALFHVAPPRQRGHLLVVAACHEGACAALPCLLIIPLMAQPGSRTRENVLLYAFTHIKQNKRVTLSAARRHGFTVRAHASAIIVAMERLPVFGACYGCTGGGHRRGAGA